MKNKKFILIIGLLICTPTSFGASFNCNMVGKTRVETAICSNAALSRLDSEMSDAYFQLLNTPKVNKSALKKTQRSWLTSRKKLCFEENELNQSPEQCLSKLYQSRISALLSHPLAGSDLPD